MAQAHDEVHGDAAIESALQSLVRELRQARLHEFLLVRARIDLDRAGAAVLPVLNEQSASLRVSELAERLHVDTPAVSRKVRQLERAGLVGRSGDQADRRASRLELTDSGRAAIDATLRARRDWLAEVLGEWSADEQAALALALRRFADGVDRYVARLDP
ncbi:MAG TPA: MarR family transcriptional regulator [Actinocrinis sp.]|nr:MarR family transcriptional regulator [Actinocrinis sp.]